MGSIRKRSQQGPTTAIVRDPADLKAVTRQVAVAALRISEDQLDRLTKAGVLRKPSRHGVHDLLGLLEDRLALLEDAGTDRTIAEAKRRYWHAHAAVEELEVEEKAGGLIPYVYAETVMTEMVAALRAEVDGNAGRLASELAAESEPAMVRRRLLEEYRGACERAARKIADLPAPRYTPGSA